MLPTGNYVLTLSEFPNLSRKQCQKVSRKPNCGLRIGSAEVIRPKVVEVARLSFGRLMQFRFHVITRYGSRLPYFEAAVAWFESLDRHMSRPWRQLSLAIDCGSQKQL